MKFDLFKPGTLEYYDLDVDKPVIIDEDTLKEIASKTGTINLTNEHTKQVIGKVSNFVYEEGVLKCDVPDDINMENLFLSPSFQFDLSKAGDCYVPINNELIEVGLTKKPREKILYKDKILYNNSGDDDKMGNNDDLRDILNRKEELVMDQQEEITLLKKQVNDYKTSLDEKANLEKELKAKIKELGDLQKKTDEYKADSDRFKNWEANRRAKLIDEISGNDEKAHKIFENTPIEDLEYIKETQVITEPQTAITSKDGDIDHDGDKTPPEQDPHSEEAVKAFEEQFCS